MTDETVFGLVCLSALVPAGLVRDYHWWAREYLSSESRQPLSEIVRDPLEVTVAQIDMTDDDQIVAVCRRGNKRQAIPLLKLPLLRTAPGARRVDRRLPPLGPRPMKHGRIR